MPVAIALDSMQDGGRSVSGAQRVHRGTITFSGTYPTGGEPVTKASFDLPVSLDDLRIDPVKNATPLEFTAAWDKSAATVFVFRTGAVNAGAEQNPNAAFAGTARFQAVGR